MAWQGLGLGRYILALLAQGFVFILLLFFFEYQPYRRSSCFLSLFSHNSPPDSDEDSDVANERRRLLSTPFDQLQDSLVLQDVYKRYGSFVAVDHIFVGIRDRTCFGLLGQNGAGKTTTFKMLTGEVMMSGGKAICLGYDITTQISKVHENMGYCPQFDALIDQMTARETLVMFARLRGIPEDNIPTVVSRLIEIMMLEKHADKESSKYSGGNKRKLSTAVALIGDPPFIMLDEPTTGMDPAARRQLWTVLSRVRDSGRTLVLTSHSMEECEALCTEIAIMVNGRFKCLGTPQHLKTKYAQGYTIIVRVDEQEGMAEGMMQYLRGSFQQVESIPDQEGYLRYHIGDKDVKLATLFRVMEASKKKMSVLDYSVHQTTLEQVFLSFASLQQPSKQTSCLESICGCFA